MRWPWQKVSAEEIEKAFQDGGKKLRESGVRIESLAKIESMDPESGIRFVAE